MSTQLEREENVLAETAKQVEQLGDRLEASDGADRALEGEFDRRMDIYSRQIADFKARFPDAPMAAAFEASYYGYLAIRKFQSVGAMRKATRLAAKGAGKSATAGHGLVGMAVGLTGALLGGAAALGASAVAKRHEQANAREALGLLDKAIGIFDSPGPRMTKARIYVALGEPNEAIRELDVVLSRHPTDDVYAEARQLRDELLTPPKKKGWF